MQHARVAIAAQHAAGLKPGGTISTELAAIFSVVEAEFCSVPAEKSTIESLPTLISAALSPPSNTPWLL